MVRRVTVFGNRRRGGRGISDAPLEKTSDYSKISAEKLLEK
jgi:hypothetical protein